jgi:hypothetical protein
LTTNANYGVALTLVALLVISATAGAYFYYQNQQATQSRNRYVNELATATSRYDGLASSYNSSLSLANETLSLLVGTISVVNTSLPIYRQASAELSQLWGQYLDLKPAPSSLYAADVMLDFGNGTRVWYNETAVQPGWNMFTETVVLTAGDLQAQWYPEYQEHLVWGIDGVSDSQTMSWFLWSYNGTAWQLAPSGADQLQVYNGSTTAWTFCGETPSYSPECTP